MELLTVEMLQDHCHEIEEDKDNRNKARNQLLVASIVCLLFMVGEIIGESTCLGFFDTIAVCLFSSCNNLHVLRSFLGKSIKVYFLVSPRYFAMLHKDSSNIAI